MRVQCFFLAMFLFATYGSLVRFLLKIAEFVAITACVLMLIALWPQ